MKKIRLNPILILSLTLGLPVKHNKISLACYESKFLVSLRQARVGVNEVIVQP